MSGVVILTNRGWRVYQAPRRGSLDECESCRSMWLVKPPSLDMCCPDYFCQVIHDGHVFGVLGKVSHRI